MKESDILYEIGDFWVRTERFGKKKKSGYAVYQNGLTHATRVSSIGFERQVGLDRAIEEANRFFKKEKK